MEIGNLDTSAKPIPMPQTGALTPQDEAGAESLAADPYNMGATIAKNQIAAGQVNNGESRDWAENVLSGVQAALAGFGAAGRVNPGSGALAGVGAAARQFQEREDRLTQQRFENQMAQKREMTEEQKAQAQIAWQNAERAHLEHTMRNENREIQQKMTDSDIASAALYDEGNVPRLYQGLKPSDLARMLKVGPNGQAEINGHEVVPLRDGMADMIGADGKPILDADGLPQRAPTYSLFAGHGTVTLDKDQAKFIADHTSYKPKEGQEMSVPSYHTLHTLAQTNQGMELKIQEAQSKIAHEEAETGKAKEETLEKQDQRNIKEQVAKFFPRWLAASGGDEWNAIQLMKKDPVARMQIGLVEQAYGPGVIEKMHHDRVEEAQKAEELRLKKLDDVKVWGDPNATTKEQFRASLNPQQLAEIEMVRQGRAPLGKSGYILTRNPGFIGAMETLYPGEVNLGRVEAYQKATEDFTTGKDADRLQDGAVAIDHLQQLRAINDRNPIQVHIPGTPANKDYNDLADTAAGELASFYGEKTIPGIQTFKGDLTGVNRDTAINRQISSMGVRMETYDDKWKAAAPSPAYEAQMPGNYATLRAKMAQADPAYRASLAGTARPIPGQAHPVIVNGRQVGVTRDGGKTMTPN